MPAVPNPINALLRVALLAVLLGSPAVTVGLRGAAGGDTARIELGYPDLQVHSSNEIGAPRGSRFVSFDGNGRILFSAEGELSAFDGSEWKRVSAPGRRNQEDFVAVEQGPDGELYVGGFAFWGRLETDFKGRYVARNLSTAEQEASASMDYMSHIAFRGDDVFFAGLDRLARWSPDSGTEVWEVPSLEQIFEHGGDLYVVQQAAGLFRLVDHKLQSIEGSAELLSKDGNAAPHSVPWFDGRVAIYSAKHGLILFDGSTFEDIPDTLAKLVKGKWVNDMKRVNDQLVALSVSGEGLLFVDADGEIVMRVDQSLDPRLAECGSIAIAPDQSVWVTLSDGVAQILFPSPITFVDQRFGVPLNYFSFHRWNDALYIRAGGKLYRSAYDDFGFMNEFRPLDSLPTGLVLASLPTGRGLLLGINDGLYRLDETGSAETLLQGITAYRILESSVFPNRYIITGPELASVVEETDSGFRVLQSLPIGGRANKLLEDGKGDVWLERGISKIGRLAVADGEYRYNEYGVADGLTSDQWIAIWSWEDETLFTSRKGVLRFDTSQNRFVIAEEVNSIIPDRIRKLTRPARSPTGDLWIAALDGNVVMRRQPDGSYVEDRITLQQLADLRIYDTTFDPDGTVWLGSKQTLTRIAPREQWATSDFPAPRIVQVTEQKGGTILQHLQQRDAPKLAELDSSQNSLTFAISTPYYQTLGGLRHRYWLKGHTDEWSEARPTSEFTFSRLPAGDYELLLQALTKSGRQSPVTSIPFSISAPFYQTLPAYLLYALAATVFIFLLLVVREKKLKKQQRALEATVNAQTREMREKNLQLHKAYLSERDLKRQAELASKAKSDFLAMVSHEIRTPMNCVIGMTDFLLESPVNATQHQMLTTIKSSGQSLLAIISDILDYSKIQAGKIELEAIPFSPATCAQTVSRLFMQACRDKGLSLELDIDASLPAQFIGDPVRLSQILINLVGNAQKFTSQGSIRISLKYEPRETGADRLYFAVADSGIGIDATKMDKLFRSFSQLDSSNTRKFGGTGLGLAISRKLTNLMGGEMSVSSIHGQGSTFSFYVATRVATDEEILAFAESEHSAPVDAKLAIPFLMPNFASASEISDAPKDILVVEDNSINQQVTAMMLRRLGYTCDIVNNGKQACDLASKKPYKLILMDIQMPEMDGIECTRRIVKSLNGAAPPILAVTAKASDFDREIVYEAGMVGYMTKPLERAKLKATLQQILGRAAPTS